MKKIISFGFFQNLGKTFMLPISLMAFMGLFLGVGEAFTSQRLKELYPFLSYPLLNLSLKFLSHFGSFAFQNLSVLFAIAIPLGLAKYEKGVAAFSGFVGFLTMHLSIHFYLKESLSLLSLNLMREGGQSIVLGVQSIEMGVLGGIISGLLTTFLHNKFYNTKLPNALAFFSGVRFVPIITSITLSLLGLTMPLFMPLIIKAINYTGLALNKTGVFAPLFFGSGERLLLPFGLHHIWVSIIRFTGAGGSAIVDGREVFGALNIYYAELQSSQAIEHFNNLATRFLSGGKMPTFMFGLPGAALALYHTAKNKESIKGLLISAFLASFVTGITEPIEFLFLFSAPLLYLIHSLLTGLGFMMVGLLEITIGNTDGGIIDFIIFGILQGEKTKWYLMLPLGAIWFSLYYIIFKKYILKFNVQTPGRDSSSNGRTLVINSESARRILDALGGIENIKTLDNCITRLRISIYKKQNANLKALNELGALGIVWLDDFNLQIVIGTRASQLKEKIDLIMEDK